MAPPRTTPAALLLTALACSTPAASPPPEERGLGGATFVLWPPAPEPAVGSAEDNPWLTGVPVGSSTDQSASGGAGTDSLPEWPAAGTSTGAQASGGLSADGGGPSGTLPPGPGPARLMFRAYVESAASFKGLLLEHVAGGPSAACFVDLYSNGSTEVWRSLAVPAGLELGERILLCIPDGAVPACSVGYGGSVYNGNDALVLRCEGEAGDTIGIVGVDPGKGWVGSGYDGASTSTADGGLWRCAGGGPSSSPAFDSLEWMSWDWASDPSWQGPVCPQPDLGLAGSSAF